MVVPALCEKPEELTVGNVVNNESMPFQVKFLEFVQPGPHRMPLLHPIPYLIIEKVPRRPDQNGSEMLATPRASII